MIPLPVSYPILPLPFDFLPPFMHRHLWSPPSSLSFSSLLPGLGTYLPDPATVVLSLLPAAVPPPDIAPLSYKSWYTGWWCSVSGGRMSLSYIDPPLPSLCPEAGTPTALRYLSLVEFLSSGGPTCGGNRQGSARSWGFIAQVSFPNNRGAHSSHWTLWWSLSRCVSPYPVIFKLYPSKEWSPIAQQG